MFSKVGSDSKFNVVIDAGEWDFSGERPCYSSKYKLARLNKLDSVEPGVYVVLHEDSKEYKLQGSAKLRAGLRLDLTLEDNLKFCSGLILPIKENSAQNVHSSTEFSDKHSLTRLINENPYDKSYIFENDVRGIFTRSGEIFLNEKMDNFGVYLELIDDMNPDVKSIFNCKKIERAYQEAFPRIRL